MSKKVQIAKFTAIFDPDEEGKGYTVTVPALPGCITEGDTFEEAVKMAEEAIGGYLESLRKHNEPIPEEKRSALVSIINVQVPTP